VEVSAKTGKGIDNLLEMITLVSDMEELRADLDAPASGIVIESSLDKRRGPSASILLQNGTLSEGKVITTSSSFGRIKSIEDSRGQKIETLLPSQPAVVIGLDRVPLVGETFREMESGEEALTFIKSEQAKIKMGRAKNSAPATPPREGQKTINIVLKTDVLGSLEVLQETIKQIPQTDTLLDVVYAGAGETSLSDVKTARAAGAIIIGFRVKTNPDAKAMAEREKIRVMNFEIIYELIEWLRQYMEKSKTPQVVRKDMGKLKVLLSFWAEKSRQIVGGKIIDGEVKRGVKIEVVRNERIVGSGRLINLQKNKKDIDEAGKGEEVGILYEGAEKIQEGDILVFYTQERNF